MYTRHRTIIRPRGDLRVPNHHTHGDVGVDVAGMGVWPGQVFFFCRAHKGQKQHHTSLPHVKVGACTPTRRGRRVACMWRVGRIIYTVPKVVLYLPLMLFSCIQTRQSTLKLAKRFSRVFITTRTTTSPSSCLTRTPALFSPLMKR